MNRWEYKVAYVDYQGRISVEGMELHISSERRTAFVRRYLNSLGAEGWELVGIQPLDPHSAYYVFKRPAQEGGGARSEATAAAAGAPESAGGAYGA